MPIRLLTLGGLGSAVDGAELDWLGSQWLRAAVLVYLTVERSATRDAFQAMFWPDSDSDSAGHRLSQAVYALRRAIGEDAIETRGRELRAGPHLEADALDFEKALESDRYEEAIALYQGPFLDGVHLAPTNAFQSWVDTRRAKYARDFRKACRAVVDARADAGDLHGAIAIAQKWAAPDPLDDEAQHRLIELLAISGARNDALKQYENYKRLLEAEGLEPLDHTRSLKAEIERKSGTIPAGPTSRAPGADRADVAVAPTQGAQRPPGAIATAGTVRRWRLWYAAVPVVGILVWIGIVLAFRRPDPATVASASPRPPDVLGLLPVQPASGSRDLGGFAKAFEARLSSELAGVTGLILCPSEAIAPYHIRGWPLDSIASALDVDFFLKTTVSEVRDSMVIDLQLIEVENQSVAHTRTLREPSTADPFALLDALGRRAAELFRETLAVQINSRRLEEGTDDEDALRLRYEAEYQIELARQSRVRAESFQLVESHLASADSLLLESQKRDPRWDAPRLRRAVTAEIRTLNILARSTDRDYAAIRNAYDDGIAAVNEVLGRQPTHAEALGLRGRLRLERAQLGQPRLAEDTTLLRHAENDLRSALERDPTLARAAAVLSDLLFDRGRHDEAVLYAQQAYDHDRYLAANSRIIDHLARSKFELGYDLEAARLCGEGLRRYPDNPAHPGCLLEVMAWGSLTPVPDSAWAHYRAVLQRVPPANLPDVIAYYGMAMASVLARATATDSAVAVLEHARQEVERATAPGNPLRNKMLGWEAGVRFRLSDPTGANKLLAQLRDRDPTEAAIQATRRILRSYVSHEPPRVRR
ncbi:MAG: BTAD domain-containing putative transcriptional regulator [Longimicrobiales bacterium]